MVAQASAETFECASCGELVSRSFADEAARMCFGCLGRRLGEEEADGSGASFAATAERQRVSELIAEVEEKLRREIRYAAIEDNAPAHAKLTEILADIEGITRQPRGGTRP
jgi:hypothetical protein